MFNFYFFILKIEKIKSPCCHRSNLYKLSLFFGSKNIDDLKNIKSKEINEWMKAKFKYDFNHVRKDLNQG